jgi:hypothetical protein
MRWQGFLAMHAAVLPIVFWLTALWRTRAARFVRPYVVVHAAVLVVAIFAMAIASPMYRRGGRGDYRLQLRAIDTVVEELGVRERCTVKVNPEKGFYSPLLEGREGWFVPPRGRM